ncbi:MAG: replication initiator protein [Arizlama microvirus]|nr:MAG: replication initiator protein [Arizlama microvirus]
MPCTRPIPGWFSREANSSGKHSIVFSPREAALDRRTEVPCGKCDSCKLRHARDWAVRIVHETTLHPVNTFITLTYSDEHLPEKGSLQKADFQKFMKRLRKMYAPRSIRYYYCGEYGSKLGRPHYHAILFNWDFPDKYHWRDSNGNPCYRSPALEDLWPYGISEIGSVTLQSAGYVARYTLKKHHGADAKFLYEGKLPEYTDMSRRSGIGKEWFKKYWKDVFPDDFVILNGKKLGVPRYYSGQFELIDSDWYQEVKEARVRKGRLRAHDNTPDRLKTKEHIQQEKLKLLKRTYENDY